MIIMLLIGLYVWHQIDECIQHSSVYLFIWGFLRRFQHCTVLASGTGNLQYQKSSDCVASLLNSQTVIFNHYLDITG